MEPESGDLAANLGNQRQLDEAHQRVLDSLTELTAQICRVPIVAVVCEDVRYFRSLPGIQEAEAENLVFLCELPTTGFIEIHDLQAHPSLHSWAASVHHRTVRFYASTPIINASASVIGHLCMMDFVPRNLSSEQKDALKQSASVVAALLDASRSKSEAAQLWGILDQSPSEVYMIDTATLRFRYVNASTCQHLQYSEDELHQMTPYDISPACSVEKVKQLLQPLCTDEVQSVVIDTERQRKDGSAYPIEMQVIKGNLNNHPVWVSIACDISERKAAEDALAKSEERFRIIAQTTNDVVWDWDLRTDTVTWNEGVYKTFGYNEHQLPKTVQQWIDYVHPEDRTRVMAGIENVFDHGGEYWADDYRFLKGDGTYAFVHNRGAVIRDAGKPIRFMGALVDMTALKRTEERLTYLAQNDPLTGLANRNLFYDHLQLAMSRASRHDQMMALFYLDLDRFKEVNDALGHDAGDRVLKEVAQRLRECLRETDLISRLGGDEFTVILEDVTDVGAAAAVAEKIIQSLAAPIGLGKRDVYVSTSIGISIYPHDATLIEDLVKEADSAMYYAKRQGRNNFQFYAPSLNARAVERLEMETLLRQAISKGELLLHYQPQVNLKTKQMIGVEALLRWESPQLGFLMPDRFIPLAEETGLIVPIGEWVLKTACRQNKAWQAAGLPALRTAVNLSALQLRQAGFAEKIRQILQETGILAEHLELEITEACLVENKEVNRDTLADLKSMGICIAIDDFGTGYSSMSYLKEFPLDILKIDQSFVRGLPENSGDAAIATAIITMAHHLKLRVIAEGIERPEQATFLANRGCDYGQGFLYSKPQPPDVIAQIHTGG